MAEPQLLPPRTFMALAHDGLRFSLASAPALILSANGDDVRRALVADFYANVLLGLEVHHHGEEELLFPMLIERFPEEQGKVDLGAKQHHEVVVFLAAAKAAVTDWQANGDGGSGSVLAALEALEENLSIHLQYEETEIVPLENGLSSEERRVYLARTREHHVAKLPNVAEFLLSLHHGQALLWESVGEALFREMIAGVRQAP